MKALAILILITFSNVAVGACIENVNQWMYQVKIPFSAAHLYVNGEKVGKAKGIFMSGMGALNVDYCGHAVSMSCSGAGSTSCVLCKIYVDGILRDAF